MTVEINIDKKLAKLKKEMGVSKLASELQISKSSLYRVLRDDPSVTYRVWNKVLLSLAPPYEVKNPTFLGSEGYIFRIWCQWADEWSRVYRFYFLGIQAKLWYWVQLGSLWNGGDSVVLCNKEDFQKFVEEVSFSMHARKQFCRYYA